MNISGIDLRLGDFAASSSSAATRFLGFDSFRIPSFGERERERIESNSLSGSTSYVRKPDLLYYCTPTYLSRQSSRAAV